MTTICASKNVLFYVYSLFLLRSESSDNLSTRTARYPASPVTSKNTPLPPPLVNHAIVKYEDDFTSDESEFSAMTNMSRKSGGVSTKIPIKRSSSLHRYTPQPPRLRQ